MEYIVKFVVDTDDGLTEESRKGNSIYVRDWFDKLSAIVAESDNDVLLNIDPYTMRLLSVERGFILKPAQESIKKWYQFWK